MVECPGTPPRRGVSACAAADFELTENGSLLTGKTHITGEDKFAARATGAAAKRRNRQGGDTREADQNIVPGIETSSDHST